MAPNSVPVLSTRSYAIHNSHLQPTIGIAGLKPTNTFTVHTF